MTYDYLPYFEREGIRCTVSPLQDDSYLLDSQAKQRGEKGRSRIAAAIHRTHSVLRRVRFVMAASRYDAVVLEKDLINSLPYALEWLLFALNPRVIVQYDEATHTGYQQRGWFIDRLTRGKIRRIVQRAAHVIVWNDVMRKFAEELNPNITIVSTGFDLERYVPKTVYRAQEDGIRIGWIGSRGGFAYLHMLDDVVARLAREEKVELYVVSSEDYAAPGVRVTNRRWCPATETQDLAAMDIGVMPLPDDEWASGKSGCKMLQYMAAGVPVVVSAVGINGQIVDNRTNGLLATTPQSWFDSLHTLIQDEAKRAAFGQEGRRYVEDHNDQAVIARKLIAVVRTVAGNEGSRSA